MLDQQTVFLFSDTQIKSEIFMEDINSLLNSGDVPNLFAADEVEEIFQSVRGLLQEQGLPPTTANLYAAFIRRVRSNLRVVVTMSPIGEAFRARLRQFPALVNCCTIDWFADWPPEALDAVARHHLDDVTAMPDDPALREGVVAMFSAIHTDVAQASQRFLQELSRHNYVTPKSFLTLLTCFAALLGRQQEALTQGKNRLRTGLDKLLQTGKDVAVMQVELEAMQPELEHAAIVAEVSGMMCSHVSEPGGLMRESPSSVPSYSIMAYTCSKWLYFRFTVCKKVHIPAMSSFKITSFSLRRW